MSIYAYHMVPKKMQGKYIIPLNGLKSSFREIFNENVNKYKGREGIFDIKLSDFDNIQFGDFSNFLFVNPEMWIKEVKSKNLLSNAAEFSFFKIPIEAFDVNYTKVFRYTPDYSAPFEPLETVGEYQSNPIQSIPEYVKQYYLDIAKTGERLVFYHLLPHLITTKKVNIEGCEIINVS